jgi:hypothetical protein
LTTWTADATSSVRPAAVRVLAWSAWSATAI